MIKANTMESEDPRWSMFPYNDPEYGHDIKLRHESNVLLCPGHRSDSHASREWSTKFYDMIMYHRDKPGINVVKKKAINNFIDWSSWLTLDYEFSRTRTRKIIDPIICGRIVVYLLLLFEERQYAKWVYGPICHVVNIISKLDVEFKARRCGINLQNMVYIYRDMCEKDTTTESDDCELFKVLLWNGEQSYKHIKSVVEDNIMGLDGRMFNWVISDLWNDYDIQAYPEGIGNYFVWLPLEMEEDVLDLARVARV